VTPSSDYPENFTHYVKLPCCVCGELVRLRACDAARIQNHGYMLGCAEHKALLKAESRAKYEYKRRHNPQKWAHRLEYFRQRYKGEYE
jgi:hypothetical protein